MSRIGRKPVVIPEKVTVKTDGGLAVVAGPLGTLKQALPAGVTVTVVDGKALVGAPPITRQTRGFQGMFRAILQGMVHGVSVGFERDLEISGVGYKADLKGDTLNFTLGYTHPIQLKLPAGIKAEVDKTQTKVKIKGSDKQLVGQIAAQIRAYKEPEPYKGKGVKYATEVIRRKVGKAGAKA